MDSKVNQLGESLTYSLTHSDPSLARENASARWHLAENIGAPASAHFDILPDRKSLTRNMVIAPHMATHPLAEGEPLSAPGETTINWLYAPFVFLWLTWRSLSFSHLNVTMSLRSTMLSSPQGFVAIFRPKTDSVVQTQRTTIYFTVFIINNNSSTTQIKHLNQDCKSLTETVTLDPRSLSALILPNSRSVFNVPLYTIRGGGAGGGATRRR